MQRFDVIVVGGGPAGLTAALILGRSRRRVIVCDAGTPRNAAAAHAHGLITRDGMPPLEILAHGRQELRAYGVEFRSDTVEDIRSGDGGVEVTTSSGARLRARKVLLATGVRDVLPQLQGFAELYGTSIHHCPYCDGWEHRDRPLAVYGSPDPASGLALSLLTWSRDLVVCTDGRALTSRARQRLQSAGLSARTEPIVRLEGTDGKLQRIVFARGPVLEREAMFFSTGQVQKSQLAAQIGCQFTRSGHVRCDRGGRTGVPHLFIAGDAKGDVQFVVVAAAEGAKAAVAINKELQQEDRAGIDETAVRSAPQAVPSA